jgi:hypothetical protein
MTCRCFGWLLRQRPGRLTGVQRIRHAAKQVVDRSGVVSPPPLGEPRVPDLAAVHRPAINCRAWPRAGATFPPISGSMAPATFPYDFAS